MLRGTKSNEMTSLIVIAVLFFIAISRDDIDGKDIKNGWELIAYIWDGIKGIIDDVLELIMVGFLLAFNTPIGYLLVAVLAIHLV